jgi:hypothetical protein
MDSIWTSSVSSAMVDGWDEEKIQTLIGDLDDAVMNTCLQYGIGETDAK